MDFTFPAEFLQHIYIVFATLFGMAKNEQKAGLEESVEKILFGARWLLAPFYIGLTLALLMLMIKFGQTFWTFGQHVISDDLHTVTLGILGLLDMTLLGNLILIVIFAGYENFVSKIGAAENSEDRPQWMGRVDYSGLKIKLIGSLVAISVIELLKDFVEAREDLNAESIKWRIAIHLTFVISGLLFAVMDYITDKRLVMDKKGELGPH